MGWKEFKQEWKEEVEKEKLKQEAKDRAKAEKREAWNLEKEEYERAAKKKHGIPQNKKLSTVETLYTLSFIIPVFLVVIWIGWFLIDTFIDWLF